MTEKGRIKKVAEKEGYKWLVKNIQEVRKLGVGYIGEGNNRHVCSRESMVIMKNGVSYIVNERASSPYSGNLDIVKIF